MPYSPLFHSPHLGYTFLTVFAFPNVFISEDFSSTRNRFKKKSQTPQLLQMTVYLDATVIKNEQL